jgi:hypothetical protein
MKDAGGRWTDAVRLFLNVYPDLPDPLRRRIASAWARSFAEWGYKA